MLLSIFFSTRGMEETAGDYFFAWPHFLYLLINVLLFIGLWYYLKQKSKEVQNKIITIFLIAMLLLKYAGDVLFIYEYYNVAPILSIYPHPFWDVDTFFSFQMCGITNILLPLTIWFNIKPLKEFVYTSSILGGIAVILYPVTVLYGHPYYLTLPIIRSSVVHFFLLFIPIFLINRGDYKLSKTRWKQIVIGIALLATWAMIGNLFIDIGDNNLYLMENPFLGGSIPILNVLPSGWHNIALAVLVFIGYVLIYYLMKLFEPNGFKYFISKFRKTKQA